MFLYVQSALSDVSGGKKSQLGKKKSKISLPVKGGKGSTAKLRSKSVTPKGEHFIETKQSPDVKHPILIFQKRTCKIAKKNHINNNTPFFGWMKIQKEH